MRSEKKIAAGLVALSMAASVTWGIEIKKIGGTDLNAGASWENNVAPGPNDVALLTLGSANGTLSASTEWQGIRVDGGATTTRSVNSAAFTLTLGSSGIDMTGSNVDFSTSPNTGNLTLGANQSWTVPTGRLLTNASITGGTGTITKEGAGTLFMNNGASTFTGGIVVNGGFLTSNSTTTVAGDGTITTGAFGKGTITFAGGTGISSSGASGRDFANNVILNGDITVGNTSTGRIRAAGSWDLGGQTRTLTLTNASTALNAGDQFGFIASGGRTFHLLNGTLRLAAGSAASAANPALVQFATTGGSFFDNNSGLVIGANVRVIENSNQTQGGASSPSLTVESGGQLLLTNGTASKTVVVHSLSGSGLVSGTPTDTSQTFSTLTIDGGAGTLATFAGTIQDNLGTAVPGTNQNGQVRLLKTGGGTQILSNTHSYTGATTVSGGILQVDGNLGATTTTVSGTVDLAGTLAGNGIMSGSVSLTGLGQLSPGGNSSGANTIGTLTIANTLSLGGSSVSSFDILSSTVGSDKVTGVTALTYGGTLNVTNLGPTELLAAGQVYDLFDFGSQTGTFGAINLPALPDGLAWKQFDGTAFDYSNGLIQIEAAAVTSVPEPGVMVIMLPAAALLSRRRR